MTELASLFLPWAVLILIGGISLFLPPGKRKILLLSILQGMFSLVVLVGGILLMGLLIRLVFGNSLETASLFYGVLMAVIFFNGWIVLIITSVIACYGFYKKLKFKT